MSLETLIEKLIEQKLNQKIDQALDKFLGQEKPVITQELKPVFIPKTRLELCEEGFPKEWEARANALIEKNVIFGKKDVGIRPAGYNVEHNRAFMEWIKTHPNVIVTRDYQALGKPYIFTPFYWENGVKILGTTTARNKDVIRGAAFSPVKKRELLEELA